MRAGDDYTESTGRSCSSKVPTVPGAHTFGVTVGHLGGLYPGRTGRLSVSYTNPNAFTLLVTHVVVGTAGSRHCGRRFFVTGSYDQAVPVRIPGRTTVSTTVPFGMRLSAPDACQGASVVVHVAATAVKS